MTVVSRFIRDNQIYNLTSKYNENNFTNFAKNLMKQVKITKYFMSYEFMLIARLYSWNWR